MGHEIASSKLNQLSTFTMKMSNELQIYAILSFFTFGLFYFINRLKQYFIILSVFLLIHFVFIAEITEFVIFKRFYQMLLTLPLLWIFFDFFKFKKETYKNRITNGFLYITLLCLVLPGLYLPPFFSGIQGWTTQIDKTENFPIAGVFLVREDGEEIRFSRSIVSPINFVLRVNSYMARAEPQKLNELLKFYKKVYKKRYSILASGFVPSQNILGKLAYPTHNPHGDFDYSKFPPKSIKEIKISTKYYNWDKEFIKEEIIAREIW
ncbi:MAG TPA: hypothetical protein EYG80_06765 [Flavobacteriaceae bacterium]|nr:hypothetical protein [Flavobacteriaceae bacterium]